MLKDFWMFKMGIGYTILPNGWVDYCSDGHLDGTWYVWLNWPWGGRVNT